MFSSRRACPFALWLPIALAIAGGVSRASAQGGLCGWPIVPLGVYDSAGPFVAGCAHEYALRELTGYRPLDFSALPGYPGNTCGNGGAGFACYIEQGYRGCVDSALCVPTKAGDMLGPTKLGIQRRFTADTDQRESICYEDYHGNGERFVICPIVATVGGCTNQVQGYGEFFLKSIPANGDMSAVVTEFLRTLSVSDPTPVHASSWGAVKTIYR